VSRLIKIVQKGMLTTVQDTGRWGYQRFGVPVSGAMDWLAALLANIIVGNDTDAPVIEATIIGPTLDILEDSCLAITGANFAPKLNGEPIEMNRRIIAPAASRLELGAAKLGARGYLAFLGGLDVPLDLGSASTQTRAGLGGINCNGRPLQNGDTLGIKPTSLSVKELGKSLLTMSPSSGVSDNLVVSYSDSPCVRVVLEARPEYFAFDAESALLFDNYTVESNSDRMGYRLKGPAIPYAPGFDGNIISEGVAFGSIQIVSGQPYILMADRQTTGGYAQIGSVIMADLPLVAQLRPGDTLSFTEVTLSEAQAALRELLRLTKLLADEFSYQFKRGTLIEGWLL